VISGILKSALTKFYFQQQSVFIFIQGTNIVTVMECIPHPSLSTQTCSVHIWPNLSSWDTYSLFCNL